MASSINVSRTIDISIWLGCPDITVDFTNRPTNATDAIPPVAAWTVLPVISLLTLIFGVTSNASVLFTFAKNPTLRNPFNVYVINLMTANLLCMVVQYPFDIVSNLYAGSWFLGERVCTIYTYAQSCLEATCANAHQLIALNRLWAVLFPLSYRTHHQSHQTAIFLCLAMWVYVHVGEGYGWLLDALYYRCPVAIYGCQFNLKPQPMMEWNLITQIVYNDWVLLLMVLALPIIFLRKVQRNRRNATYPMNNTITFARQGAAVSTVSSNDHGTSHGATPNHKRHVSMEDDEPDVHVGRLRTMSAVVSSVHVPDIKDPLRSPKRRNFLSTADVLLVLLTVSVCVCWTPSFVYYTITCFVDLDGTLILPIANVIFGLQPMVDPVFFVIASAKIRGALCAQFLRC